MKGKIFSLKEKILDLKYELLFFGFALFKLFWPYGSFRYINVVINFFAVFSLIIYFVFLTRKISEERGLPEGSRKAFRLLLSFFWVGFVSNAALYLENWPKDYEGTKHALAVICYLLIFVVFNKGKLKWLIPFLIFVMVAFKPEITPVLLPSIFLLFYFHSRDGNFSDEIKDLLASSTILTVIALAILLPKALKKIVSFSGEKILLHIKTSLFSYFVIVPMIIFLAVILFKASYLTSNKRTKTFFKVMFFSSFLTLPILPFLSNNVSLSMLNIFATMVLMSYLISENEKNTIKALEHIWCGAERKEYAFLIFLSVVFMAYFSAFTKSSLGSLFYSQNFVDLWPK